MNEQARPVTGTWYSVNSGDTTCAGCGKPVDLTELHLTIVEQLERETPGLIHVESATVRQYRHRDCHGAPPESKNPDPDGCPDTVLGPCEWACARCGRGHDCAEAR